MTAEKNTVALEIITHKQFQAQFTFITRPYIPIKYKVILIS